MKNIFTLLIILIATNSIFSQNIWQEITYNSLQNKELVKRNNIPKKAFYYKLDLNQLKTKLESAPERWVSTDEPVIIDFPNSDGVLESYKVLYSPIMHTTLAAKYPSIKTYVAQGINDATAYMRFSVTNQGLHTMCLSGNKSANYIDPFTQDKKYYIVYNKKSLGKDTQPFECLMGDFDPKIDTKSNNNDIILAVDDQKIRKYRLALTCNAEYGNLFGLTTGTELVDIQTQMAVSINRVNSVFEIDLGITLEFVANNDLLIYFGDVSADPWLSEYNATTAITIDNTIGVTAYDIGHNFNTNGGGNAGCLSCVCLSVDQYSTHKGRGQTGRYDPTGDPFDIDYVAHEMGHQFGGFHVMNTCSRSGSGLTEVEPASGSSIMGYAGICPTDVQSNSDAHFNYVNVRDITLNTQPGGNSDCAEELTTTNQTPTANAGNDYTIPRTTAFVLEGTATDPDGLASLTYNWSQNDPEEAPTSGSPQTNWTVGPLYRSIYPTTTPNRYMPSIDNVIAGNLTPTWEVTPAVSRIMNFAFMVRDNDILGAQTADDLMVVTVDGTSGPFVVTSQTTNQNWMTGETKTITWDVAGTNTGSVNTPNVDIFLSLDGGYTYPISLETNTPNDGSHSVTIPSSAVTTNGKIMVRGANNIFYALNSGNIEIAVGDFTIDFSTTTISTCDYDNVVYNFIYSPISTFSENVTFTTVGLPAGLTATFNPVSASTTTNVQLTISGISSSVIGINNFQVFGTSTSTSQSVNLVLGIVEIPIAPTLTSPLNNATDVAAGTIFSWNPISGSSVSYTIEISADPSFSTIVESVSGLTTNSYSSSSLVVDSSYYWRVSTTNICGTSSMSSVFYFSTSSCSTTASSDIPISIIDSDIVTSQLNISSTGIINDIDVINISGVHTFVGDLRVSLTSPTGTSAILWSGECGGNNDFLINFDDDASTSTLICPITDNAFYIPSDNLNVFNGENAFGNWILTIEDMYNGDVGALDSWSLKICSGEFVCNMPDVPTVSASKTDICNGDLTTLTVSSGNLNDAINWVWYTNSCGTGTAIGTGSSINIYPTTSTTYYVRGEGSCVADATCSSLDITVHENTSSTEILQANDSTEINGVWYYSSQQVVNTYSSVFGCDSIVTTDLTVISNPNAIINITGENVFKLFPNPNNGLFTIKLNSNLLESKNKLVIYDMIGSKIISLIDLKETTIINLEKHSKGVYHVYFQNESYIIQRDIIVK